MKERKPFFVPDDFEAISNYRGLIANIANAKLQAAMDSWPVVQGRDYGKAGWCYYTKLERGDAPTHTARLAFIEPIKKVECEHFPIFKCCKTHIFCGHQNDYNKHCPDIICAKCGCKLKPPQKWEKQE